MPNENEVERMIEEQIFYMDAGQKRQRLDNIMLKSGEGGYGDFYAADDLMTGDKIGFKIAKESNEPHVGNGEDERTRKNYKKKFLRERQAMEALSHPHLISYRRITRDGKKESGEVTTLVTKDGKEIEVIFMELAVTDLKKKSDRMGIEELITGFAGICDAFHHAHQKGFTSRDIKPSHLVIGNDGLLKYVDWGESKFGGGDTTGPGKGTRMYKPPLKSDELATPSADIYQLAVTFWEVLHYHLTGKRENMFSPAISSGLPEDQQRAEEEKQYEKMKKDPAHIKERIGKLRAPLLKHGKYNGLLDALGKAVSADRGDWYKDAEEFKMDLIPKYREFNEVYKPLKEAIENARCIVFNGDFSVIDIGTAERIAALKGNFDMLVRKNGLGLYAIADEVRKINEDSLVVYCEWKHPKNAERFRALEEKARQVQADPMLAAKIRGVNLAYLGLMSSTRSSIMKLVPVHEDEISDFCTRDEKEQKVIMDGLAAQNSRYIDGLIKEGVIKAADRKAMVEHYHALAETLYIL